MDLHIDKKIGLLLIIALLIGGVIGGSIGFVAGREEGDQDRIGHHEQYDRQNYMFGDQNDGEMNNEKSGTPNGDEMNRIQPNPQTIPNSSTTTPTGQPKPVL